MVYVNSSTFDHLDFSGLICHCHASILGLMRFVAELVR